MNALSEDDKQFIREYVADTNDAEEQKKRRKECAASYQVSLPTISAITAWTTIRGKTTVESSPITVITPDNADGSHANYDNPTKQLWREKWKQFLAKHTTLYERQSMRVLCLPGKKCLEIPLYLDLGFTPKNIVGVEGGDDAVKSEFHTNAYRYGITSKLGRLEDFLEHDPTVYDVVSLDFTGPISKNYLDIVRNVPLAPASNYQLNKKSYFMINVMAKRESTETQSIIDFYASFTRPELKEMFNSPKRSIDKFTQVHDYVSDLADKAQSGEKSYESAELKEKRSAGIAYLLTSLIAKSRRFRDSVWFNYKLDEVSLKMRQDADLDEYGRITLTTLLNSLFLYVPKSLINLLAMGAPTLIDVISNYRPFAYDVEQYQYSSPVNGNNSPYISDMYQFMTPMEDYIKNRYFVRFLIDCVFWQVLNPNQNIYVQIRHKNGCNVTPSGNLLGKDSIAFVTENGNVISTITYQRILDAMEFFFNHINKDQTINLMYDGKIPRINLSE